MNESLLKLSIEVPLNALPYHEFLCRLELRWILTPEEDSLNVFTFCAMIFRAIMMRESTEILTKASKF